MIPSPKVATYDLAPDMSAREVAQTIVQQIQNGGYDLIVANFANADMVGHTGVFDATVEAIKVLDICLDQVVTAALQQGGAVLITADHGNAEFKIDPATGKPLTAHTTSPVPVILCGTDAKSLRSRGGLADIAPTVLQSMELSQPSSMTGQSLIE
jgi:2,3-bisphosphoglycerate-independent phosphoglycerate mutase